MRRADRLLRIVQVLRARRLTTAAKLAEVLGVSERTIYRDVRDLARSGVVIAGEPGVGYRMGGGFEMPPLTLSVEEVEALILGMRMVGQWGDADLGQAAAGLLHKVESVLPEREQARAAATALFALSFRVTEAVRRTQRMCRRGINERRLLAFDYEDRGGRGTRRTVRPLGLFFWGQAWTLGAYCDLRRDFRNFRLDRMIEPRLSRAHFEHVSPVTLADYLAKMKEC